MAPVGRAVGKAVGWVGDAVESVVDFAVDEILEPVIDMASGVVEGMLADPFTTIAMIAAAVTPGMQWAVPLIAGASTAIQGGDIGDIALAVASSYVGSKVGPIVGETVGGQIGSAVGSEAVGRIAGEAAAGATRGVITAVATGGDIASAALMGAASGAGRASFSEAGSYIREGIAASEAEVAVDGTGYGSADVGMEYFESSDFVDNFNAATESVGIELADIVDTWDSIPEIAQDVITSAAGATISSLAMTGEMPNDKQLASAVTSAAIASKTTSRALTNITGISDKSAAQVAKVISDVSRTAYTGADPYEAYKASLSGVFQEDLNKAVDDITDGGLERLFDNIAGSTTTYEEALGKAETQSILVDAAAEPVNLVIDQAEALRAGQVEGFYSYEEWEQEKNAFEAGGRTDRAAYDRLNAWNEKYREITASLPNLRTVYDEQVLRYNEEIDKVKAAEQALFTDQEYLDQAVEPLYVVANKGFTEALRPNFNEAEYRELNNLSSNTDAHGHWLATGRSNPVNRQEHNAAIDGILKQKLYNLTVSQEDKKWRSSEDFDKFESGLVAATKAAIGDDLNAARNLDLSADSTLTPAVADVRAAVNAYINDAPDLSRSAVEAVAEPIAKAPGTTDADIASGKARLVAVNKSLQYAASASGGGQRALQFTTEDVNWTEPAFNPEFNTETRTVFSPTTNQYIVLDSESGAELQRLTGGGDVLPDGTVVPADDRGVVFGAPLPPPPPTLAKVAKINPVAAIDAAGKLKLNEEEYNKLDFFSRSLVDLSIGVKDTIEYLDTNRAKIKEEYGIDVGDLDGVRTNAGTVLGAGGELLSGFNGIVSFFRNSRNNPIDARTTNLGKATQAMIGIATATQPEEYNNLVKEWNKSYQPVEGFIATIEAIGEGLLDPKYRSVVLREVIAKEIIQEIPLLLTSVGVGTAVKAGVKGGAYVGKLIGREFAEDTVKQVSQKWGSRAAWGSNAGLQVLETAGATAGETYAITFDELMKLPGMTVEAASARAQEYAITNGLMAAAIEGVAGRVFDPGDKFVSSVVGGQKMKYALNNLTKKAAGIVGEGATEGLEEGASAYFNYQAVKEINPDSELFKPGGAYANLGNLLATNFVLGALAGTGTSTSIVAAGSVYNALSGGEPRPPSPLDTPSGGPTGAGPTQPKITNTNNVLGNALVNLNPTVNQAANDAGSSNPEVRAAGETKIREVFGYDPNYQFDGTTINVAQDPDGVYRFNTAVDILNAANDNSYNTLGEVQSGFSENTAGVPFVPSSADIQRFVGAAPSIPQAPDVAPVPSTDVLRAGIDDFIDQNYTDADEVADYFASLGYGPSQTEVQQFTGQTPETTQLATIDPYVDPRQTTTDEVLNYFTSLGYTPDQSEIALFTGQGAEDFQTTQFGAVDPYVDPRQVTRSEAEQFFADQNYPATEDDITRFVTQANDPTFQTTQEQALATEFDPLAVTEDEARTAFETAGFFDALPADVTRLTGQYAESDLGGRVQEALPVATYNSIANMLGKSGQEVTNTDIDFVTDIIAQQEVLTEPTPFTQEQLQYDVNADNVVDIADQTMLEQVMAGTVPQTQLAPTSQFAATGIQGQIQQQTQMQQQLQQQIQTQEAERLKRQTQQNQQAYMQQLLETSPVEVKTPDPASIDYVYDPFGESIFATPQQEGLFVDPFTQRNAAAQGGIVSALGGRR
jgi:hypothetical protein